MVWNAAALIGAQLLKNATAEIGALGAKPLANSSIALGWNPLVREWHSQSNWLWRNTVPEAQIVFDLYWRGLITQTEADWGLAWLGIRWGAPGGGNTLGSIWGSYRERARPRPGPDFWKQRSARFPGEEADFAQTIKKQTGWSDEDCERYVWQSLAPEMGWALEQYHLGFLTERNLQVIMRLNGLMDSDYQQWVKSQSSPLNYSLLLDARNRGFVTEDRYEKTIKALGWRENPELDAAKKMRYYVPGISDIVRFAVREVWDDAVVQRYGYDTGLPAPVNFWAEKTGLSYPIGQVFPGAPAGADITWQQAFWRAHWEVLSPHQAYEALHRFRPNRSAEKRAAQGGAPDFTIADVNRMLQIADYAPGVRDWLTQMSYSRLTRVDVRRMVKLGLMKDEQVVSAYEDLGYNRADAENLAKFAEIDALAGTRGRTSAAVRRSAEKAYRAGIIDDDRLADLTWQAVITDEPTLRKIRSGEMAVSAANLLEVPQWAQWFRALQAEIAVESATEKVKWIKVGFLNADITRERADQLLRAAGIQPHRVERYLSTWEFKREISGKRLSGAQTTTMYQHGLISQTEAHRRLLDLGYDETDATVLLSRTQQLIDLAQAKAFALQERDAKKRMAAIESLIAKQRAEVLRSQNDLARHGTPAQIARWYKKGIIPLALANRRLQALGWPDEDITRHLQDATTRAPR